MWALCRSWQKNLPCLVAELGDSDLYSLLTDAGMKYEGKPSKTDLIMSLDEIDTAVLKDLYKKYIVK